jgi:SsrA-binding protein
MKMVAQNRKARFDLEILDTVEAGIVLTGQEAKSCRQGHAALAGSYVSFLRGKVMLKKMKISPYAYAGQLKDYDPERDRVLLLAKTQIAKMQTAAGERGITVVPLEVHAGKFIKVLLGIGKGRKKLDKRQRIKERETSRRIREGREE